MSTDEAGMVAAITAGGRVDAAFAERIGTDIKALAPVGNARLIDASITAVREAGAVRIAVVGPAAVHAYCSGRIDDGLDESPSGEENLRRALRWAGDAPLVFATSDLPFVNAASVTAFLVRAHGLDVAMPLTDAEEYERTFPGAPPHTVSLGGERVANGSVFYFAPGAAPRVTEVAARLFAARKSLLSMASLLGPALLAKFALRRLRIADIERRAHALFGLRVRPVRGAFAALCFDVDSEADYEYASERLGGG